MALRRQGSSEEEGVGGEGGLTRHGCASVGPKGPPLGKYFKSCALIASTCLALPHAALLPPSCLPPCSPPPRHVLEFLFAFCFVLLARVNYCQAIYNAQRAVLPLLLVPHGVCVTIIVIKCTQYFAIATLRLPFFPSLLTQARLLVACREMRLSAVPSASHVARQNVPQTCVCIKRMTAPLRPSWYPHTHTYIYCLSLMFSWSHDSHAWSLVSFLMADKVRGREPEVTWVNNICHYFNDIAHVL